MKATGNSTAMRLITRMLCVMTAACFVTTNLFAQKQGPNIGYIYPAGGTAGTSVEAVVGGMNLNGIEGGLVSGGGVIVESVKYSNPLGRISNDLRQELSPIIKAIESGDDPIEMFRKNSEKMLEKIKKQADKGPEEKKNDEGKPADSEKTTSKGKSAGALGYDEMMKIVPGERLLYIDKTPEEVVAIIKALSPLEYQCLAKDIFKKQNALQASPAIEQKAIIKLKIEKGAVPGPRELRLYSDAGLSNPLQFIVNTSPQTAEDYFSTKESKTTGRIESFPIVLNGGIMPGEVDKWTFQAKAGGKYMFSVKARSLLPYLGDAVPGWFQAVLSVHDHEGNMLAYCDDNLIDPDPLLVFAPAAEGDYEVRIRDSIYRGREDFVYCLAAETVGIQPDTELSKPALPYEIKTISEKEDNNSPDHAQAAAFPVLIRGGIGMKNDADCYRVALNKGQKVAIEVFARRLGSPMDSVIHILDSKSNVLQWNDDTNTLNVGLMTHHADSRLLFEAPAEGRYCIKVSDAQSKGGKEYGYYLRVDELRPDFSVYMTSSALNAQRGAVPCKLKVLRHEGFDGAVEVVVKDGPAGMRVDGAIIPPEADEILITLSLPGEVKEGPVSIKLAATASIAGQTVEREVVPADEVMQAFLYMHLVPAAESILFVTKAALAQPLNALASEISIKPGETIPMKFSSPHFKNRKDDFVIELMSPLPGLSVVDGRRDGSEYTFSIQADAKAKAWSGNLVFQILVENPKQKGQRRLAGILPAIPTRIHP